MVGRRVRAERRGDRTGSGSGGLLVFLVMAAFLRRMALSVVERDWKSALVVGGDGLSTLGSAAGIWSGDGGCSGSGDGVTLGSGAVVTVVGSRAVRGSMADGSGVRGFAKRSEKMFCSCMRAVRVWVF